MTISMFESMAYERNVKLSSKIQENIMVNGNKEDIEHILSTLIDNAIKKSTFISDVDVSCEDKIITLSTCSYNFENARYILLGVLKELE